MNTIKISRNRNRTKTITGLADSDLMLISLFMFKGVAHASADEKMWPVCEAVTRLAIALRSSAIASSPSTNCHLIGGTADTSTLYTAAQETTT